MCLDISVSKVQLLKKQESFGQITTGGNGPTTGYRVSQKKNCE